MPTLGELQQQAAGHLQKLKDENADESPHAADARRNAAQERAARERQQRIDEAIKQPEVLANKSEQRKNGEKTRASTRDPDARNMKMASGSR